MSSYEKEIKNYDCYEIKDELLFLNTNIEKLEEQSQNSFFDHLMEGIVSIGIYSGNAFYKMNKNQEHFVKKKNLVLEQKEFKSCQS